MNKSELNNEIARLLGVIPPRMSTGSTESKELFLAINEVLGLGLNVKLSKPAMAREISEIGGLGWNPSCESRGSTVTAEGLNHVLEAVRVLIRR